MEVKNTLMGMKGKLDNTKEEIRQVEGISIQKKKKKTHKTIQNEHTEEVIV